MNHNVKCMRIEFLHIIESQAHIIRFAKKTKQEEAPKKISNGLVNLLHLPDASPVIAESAVMQIVSYALVKCLLFNWENLKRIKFFFSVVLAFFQQLLLLFLCKNRLHLTVRLKTSHFFFYFTHSPGNLWGSFSPAAGMILLIF